MRALASGRMKITNTPCIVLSARENIPFLSQELAKLPFKQEHSQASWSPGFFVLKGLISNAPGRKLNKSWACQSHLSRQRQHLSTSGNICRVLGKGIIVPTPLHKTEQVKEKHLICVIIERYRCRYINSGYPKVANISNGGSFLSTSHSVSPRMCAHTCMMKKL